MDAVTQTPAQVPDELTWNHRLNEFAAELDAPSAPGERGAHISVTENFCYSPVRKT